LLTDLIQHIPIFQTTFIKDEVSNPVNQMVQLCYVIPRANLQLIPPKIVEMLTQKYGHWYKEDCAFIWAYCKYFWETHVVMDDIQLEELEKWIETNKHLWA
jgi:hypothetical protein